MGQYYCRHCKRYLPTVSCAAHGTQDTVVMDPDPFKLAPSPPAQRHTTVMPGGWMPARPGVQQDDHSVSRRPAIGGAQPIPAAPQRVASDPGRTRPHETREILRFLESERLLHWAIAIPFMICWVTALVLVLVYNPSPLRPFREVFSVVHRLSGVCMILLPLLVILKRRREYKIHLFNIKEAWNWSRSDLRWLALMGLAAISKRIHLPEQGKFNAAEKINFMLVMVSWGVFTFTGLTIWLQDVAWIAWLIHVLFALLVTPTILGHIYMATVNPETRKGITGMITGYVDRYWAKHHYALWYRERFEKKPVAPETSKDSDRTPAPNPSSRHPVHPPEAPHPSAPGFPLRPSTTGTGVSPSVVFQVKEPGGSRKTQL